MKTFIIVVGHGVIAEDKREFFITAETAKDAYWAAKSHLRYCGEVDGYEYILEVEEVEATTTETVEAENAVATQEKATEVEAEVVKAYKSQCIGCIITGFHYYGVIIKTNKKSVRVNINRMVKTEARKVVKDVSYSATATYTYWKAIVASYGENKGKKVALYKNPLYGIIEMPVN